MSLAFISSQTRWATFLTQSVLPIPGTPDRSALAVCYTSFLSSLWMWFLPWCTSLSGSFLRLWRWSGRDSSFNGALRGHRWTYFPLSWIRRIVPPAVPGSYPRSRSARRTYRICSSIFMNPSIIFALKYTSTLNSKTPTWLLNRMTVNFKVESLSCLYSLEAYMLLSWFWLVYQLSNDAWVYICFDWIEWDLRENVF